MARLGPLRLLGLAFLPLLLLVACRAPQTAAPAGDFVTDAVKIEVTADGVYRVPLAALQDAGLALDVLQMDNVSLTTASPSFEPTAVPFLIADDSVIFYGRAPHSRYTAVRPYLLQVGAAGEPLATTAVESGATAVTSEVWQSLHLEENRIYTAEARVDETSDVWFWHELRQQESFPVTFTLDAVSDRAATLRLNLWGFTHNPEIENDHDFDLLVNDQLVETVRWDGEGYHTAEITLPPGVLQAGENIILLDNRPEGASFLDIFQVNWLELAFATPATAVADRLTFTLDEKAQVNLTGFNAAPRIFAVGNDTVQLLDGWQGDGGEAQFTVPGGVEIVVVGPEGYRTPPNVAPLRRSNWRGTDNAADLLIITGDELAPALEPLVQARRDEGLSVAVVPVAEIYDAFGLGAASPESIRHFVAYAATTWQTAPRYLLLVGDATTDYLGHLGPVPANTVPSLLVPVRFSGETVSDSRLADVDGDMRPDLAVGRWPVHTSEETADLVRRTLAYEQAIASRRALFAADGTESQFAAMAGQLAADAQLPDDEVAILTGPPASEVAAAWNEGNWLATYIGHGSIGRWGKNDVFDLEAVSSLEAETPPIVLQLTCLTGLFTHPAETSLSEALLSHPQGPVLLVAATSLTLSSHQEPFAAALLQQMQDPAVARIGDAFQAAKLTLDIDQVDGLREISDTFILFGDPSAHIVRP